MSYTNFYLQKKVLFLNEKLIKLRRRGYIKCLKINRLLKYLQRISTEMRIQNEFPIIENAFIWNNKILFSKLVNYPQFSQFE